VDYKLTLKGPFVLFVAKNVLTPFHAAEQHSKERICDSAERQRLSDVDRSL
jgi:hypothetical protein